MVTACLQKIDGELSGLHDSIAALIKSVVPKCFKHPIQQQQLENLLTLLPCTSSTVVSEVVYELAVYMSEGCPIHSSNRVTGC